MELIDYLKSEPRARERKNKNRAIGNLAWNQYSHNIGDNMGVRVIADKNKIIDMVGEVLSLDRKWRKILEENPDLRGTDYQDKARLEEEKLQELGYGQTP